MSHHHLLNAPILDFLPDNLGDLTVLDVGCGLGEWGFIIRTRKSGSPYLIGLDVWHPFLERVQPLSIYDELVQVKIPSIPLKDKSVEISLACEILEHLQKNVGFELLNELDRVTKDMILASVPLNMPQEAVLDIPLSEHISKWTSNDFIDCDYEIKVIRTLPKTLEIADRIRRIIVRCEPPPRLIVARKRLK